MAVADPYGGTVPPAPSIAWIDALQRKADEDFLVLQKMTGDWQNYSQALSAMKSNISSTAQNTRSLQNSLAADQQRIAMSNEMFHDLTQQVCGRWLGYRYPCRYCGSLIMFFKDRVFFQMMNLQMQLDNATVFMDEHEENMHDLQYHSR